MVVGRFYGLLWCPWIGITALEELTVEDEMSFGMLKHINW